MGFIRSLFGFVFKLFFVAASILTVGLVVLAFFLKRDVDEIKQFTQDLKNDIDKRSV